jgi:methylated-DNA-[protein]-cysteine S-methyltransferase
MNISAAPAGWVHTVIGSPVGPLTLVATGGALAGLYMERQRHRPPAEALGAPVSPGPAEGADGALLAEAAAQLRAYFAGRMTAFDLPLALAGTAFRQQVWAALREIPYGETTSYGELAAHLGQPSAARAVGLANGRNPVSIVVPCHRVVGSAGGLTGYGGGLARKRYLLNLEQQVAAGSAAGNPAGDQAADQAADQAVGPAAGGSSVTSFQSPLPFVPAVPGSAPG